MDPVLRFNVLWLDITYHNKLHLRNFIINDKKVMSLWIWTFTTYKYPYYVSMAHHIYISMIRFISLYKLVIWFHFWIESKFDFIYLFILIDTIIKKKYMELTVKVKVKDFHWIIYFDLLLPTKYTLTLWYSGI